MQLHGEQIIGGETSLEGKRVFTAVNPATGQALEPEFRDATVGEVDRAMRLAEASFDELRGKSPEQRAALLDAIADEIEALGEPLLERMNAETGLPMGRCTGERGRTVGQTRMFAAMLREGSWVNAVIDRGNPDRQPMPKPDVRSMSVPIGPVVVFGASNFPLAIGVAGTDTTTALAAGCPVVVKAHPAHPGTCEMLARAIGKAMAKAGMPAGAFSMVHGAGHESGVALVDHPAAKAVGFTGSLRGGRAIFNAAAARPEPIPVYAEMGSTNPVFILPGALAERAEAIAQGYIQSVTLGVGQFCTNPGLVFGLKGDGLDTFIGAATKHATEAAPATMLHKGIHDSFVAGVARIGATHGVEVAGQSSADANGDAAQAPCVIFTTTAETLVEHEHLFEEVFGPSSIVVSCDEPSDIIEVASNLEGHLSATIHGTEQDLADHAHLVRILEKKVGRLVFNGFPTGIEVCHAMHHGGPYPASSDPHFTSIGAGSIFRWVRPVCYQSFPDAALPPELRNKNERGIWRKIDGETTRDDA
ncbi:MAG: aldehyde dehydrogenase family protein [Phycisphaera sp.]|nr:aldehyde dehydrogenase family protein [Phycisphaera sp.]